MLAQTNSTDRGDSQMHIREFIIIIDKLRSDAYVSSDQQYQQGRQPDAYKDV